MSKTHFKTPKDNQFM